MTPPADRRGAPRNAPAVTSLRTDEPMTDELCLFVLTLDADGRAVPDELLARARGHAAAHPDCARQLADMTAVGGILSSEPTRQASADFTERVVAAARADAEPGTVLPMVRQLAVAAALLLAVSIVWIGSGPGELVADDQIDAQSHAVDPFRVDPYGPDDLDAGLRRLLPDPRPRSLTGGDESPSADEPTEGAEDGR